MPSLIFTYSMSGSFAQETIVWWHVVDEGAHKIVGKDKHDLVSGDLIHDFLNQLETPVFSLMRSIGLKQTLCNIQTHKI